MRFSVISSKYVHYVAKKIVYRAHTDNFVNS